MAKNDKKEKEDTPLIKQYYKFKAACPEALLLMRVGDFYETYGEDAVKASKVADPQVQRGSGLYRAGRLSPPLFGELYAEAGEGRLQGGGL